ncbi:MAG TPA: hypothetical protein VMR21_10500 [Vicinamibacteria bacterium]|nr:hypothetical protein [Vicinamibacteria bacterium]
MRARVLVVAVAAALAAAYLFRDAGGSGAVDRSPAPARALPPAPAGVEPLGSPGAPVRNVFEYADDPAATAPLAAAPGMAAPEAPDEVEVPAAAPEPAPLVRLIGLMRRGGQQKAALAIAGETVVLAAGESAGGFTVVSIDEDEGVSLRGPDGTTLVLPRARE